jgi:putative addiction module killer protein
MIKREGHFGHIRDLGGELFELKFNDGRRIYYTIIPANNVILILGGSKNGQDNDIRKAKNSIQKAKENAKNRINP